MVVIAKSKFIHFLSLVVICSVFGVSRLCAQQKTVTLPSREVTVGAALREAEKQGGYTIVVNLENLNTDRVVLFSSTLLSVGGVLDEALTGTGYKWEIIGEQVAIVNGGVREEHQSYSTMQRDRLPSGMWIVRDPWSRNQLALKENALLNNGYWRSGSGKDSTVMAVINYRVNSSLLERDYMDNARTLESISQTLSDKGLLSDLDFITIIAAASPEGNTSVNEKLASDRALAAKSYIMWKFPSMDRDRIFTYSIGEDWTGLRKMVYEDASTPFRDKVLSIIDTYPDSATKWVKLKGLGNGSAYRYISARMLPHLRGAAACMIYFKEKSRSDDATQALSQIDTVYVNRVVDNYIEVPVPTDSPMRKTPYYFAIKTNLLYDLALLPDLALEFSLGNRWSAEVDAQWSWWNTPTNHKNCWRIQTAGIELRKWLGSKERTPLTGHYLGLYGMAGTYDIRFNNKTGYLSDMSYSAGLSYGYSLPVARRLNLEFGLAAGYLGGKYKTYGVYNDTYGVFPVIAGKKMHYFGPTKAKIAFVWLLGSGTNEKKGNK